MNPIQTYLDKRHLQDFDALEKLFVDAVRAATAPPDVTVATAPAGTTFRYCGEERCIGDDGKTIYCYGGIRCGEKTDQKYEAATDIRPPAPVQADKYPGVRVFKDMGALYIRVFGRHSKGIEAWNKEENTLYLVPDVHTVENLERNYDQMADPERTAWLDAHPIPPAADSQPATLTNGPAKSGGMAGTPAAGDEAAKWFDESEQSQPTDDYAGLAEKMCITYLDDDWNVVADWVKSPILKAMQAAIDAHILPLLKSKDAEIARLQVTLSSVVAGRDAALMAAELSRVKADLPRLLKCEQDDAWKGKELAEANAKIAELEKLVAPLPMDVAVEYAHAAIKRAKLVSNRRGSRCDCYERPSYSPDSPYPGTPRCWEDEKLPREDWCDKCKARDVVHQELTAHRKKMRSLFAKLKRNLIGRATDPSPATQPTVEKP